MSIASVPQPFGRPLRLRWSGSEFDRAVEMGLFDRRRIELIDGDILEAPAMNDPHAQAIPLTMNVLFSVFPPSQRTVSVRCPMRLGESRPIPDFAVLAGTARENTSHPTTALLVIEVSDSTLDFDRTDKARLYAAHQLPEYWIINLNDRCVEVHRDPGGNDRLPEYRQVTVYPATDHVVPLAAANGAIDVADLLPASVSS